MIARLVLLLVAVAVVASADNLRNHAHGASADTRAHAHSASEKARSVPVDNARGARVLKRMQTKSAAKHAKAKKAMDVEALTKKASKKGLEAKAEPLIDASEKAKVGRSLQGYNDDYTEFDSPWTRVTMAGSLVTRSRPNSDCSGNVIEIGVEPAGVCFSQDEANPESGDSMAIGTYVSDSGELFRATGSFEKSGNCTGEPESSMAIQGSVKPCQMLDDVGRTGPLMGGTSLSDMSVADMARNEKAGYMVGHYATSDCSGDVLAYNLYRNDACHLDIELNYWNHNFELLPRRLSHKTSSERVVKDSKFSYVKVTMCKGTTVSITGYTDSACTRKEYTAEVDLSADQQSAYETYTQCTENHDDDYYDYSQYHYTDQHVEGEYSMGSCSG